MKSSLLLFILTSFTAFGVESVAWRVPVEFVVEGGLNNPSVSRIDQLPGESAFFKPGDELWDLSRVVKRQIQLLDGKPEENPFAPDESGQHFETKELDFEGNFAVWNARSQMIVGRGSFAQLRVLEDFINLESQPYQISTTFTLHSAGEKQSLTLFSRSGETASAQNPHFRVEVAANANFSNPRGDLLLNVEVAGFHINTNLFFRRGTEVQIATWTDGPTEHRLTAKCSLTPVWGVPIDQIQFVEVDGGIMAQPQADALKLDGREFPGGLRAGIHWVTPGALEALLQENAALTYLTPPDAMTAWIPHGLIDLKPFVAAFGVSFDNPRAVLGYDPLKAEVIAVQTPDNLDIVEQMFTGLGPGLQEMIELEFRWSNALVSLASLTGHKASIKRITDEEEQTVLEVAPHYTSSHHWIDCDFILVSPGNSFTLRSSITLEPDKSTVIAIGDKKISLTAKILSLSNE